MIRSFLFLLTLALSGPLGAQQLSTTDSLVRAMFEKPESVQWVRFFHGRIDDVFNADMALGFDGANCRGLFSYPRSNTLLKLEGTLTGPVLALQEKSELNQTSGYLKGKLLEDRLELEWVNHNNSLGSQLELRETNQGQEPSDDCGDNKWLNRYAASWKAKPVELTLVRLHNGILLGQIWSETEQATHELRGRLLSNGEFTLESNPTPGQPLHWLEGNLRDIQQTKATWTTSNGEMRVLEFKLRENLTMGCIEFADFLSSYDILYPNSTCAPCNRWMKDQTAAWAKRSQTAIQAKRLSNLPANRNVLRASMWPELSCWTDSIFSGYLNYTDSWSAPSQGIAFNFDLRNGKSIQLDDLFVREFDFKTWLNEYMRQESPKLPGFADDPKFREWLYGEGFPLFTLRRDGIKLSTLFHPIYGQQHLLIPYARIKENLRPDHPVAEFIR